MEIKLKKFVDFKKIKLEELSGKTGISIKILREMYYKGHFDGDEVGVHAISELVLILNILNISDLVPQIK